MTVLEALEQYNSSKKEEEKEKDLQWLNENCKSTITCEQFLGK